MKKIIVATTNQGKVKEIREILKDIDMEVLSMKDVLKEDIDIIEDGDTFEANAKIKAEAIRDIVHLPVLADDSGIEIDAFDKAPGVQSARFLGKDTSYDIKNQYILDHIQKDMPRSARYVCSIALALPNQPTVVFTETMEGEIADQAQGEYGFGYDPIFYFPPLKKTTAQMTPEQKNLYSHRGKALRKMEAYLKELD